MAVRADPAMSHSLDTPEVIRSALILVFVEITSPEALLVELEVFFAFGVSKFLRLLEV